MQPRLKLWIECDDGRVALSEWRVALLEAVDDHGSMVAAARALGVPQRTAWQRIREMEGCLGLRLLETFTGGLGGGGSRLSKSGKDVVQRYRAVRSGLDELVFDRYQAHFGVSAFHAEARGSGTVLHG